MAQEEVEATHRTQLLKTKHLYILIMHQLGHLHTLLQRAKAQFQALQKKPAASAYPSARGREPIAAIPEAAR